MTTATEASARITSSTAACRVPPRFEFQRDSFAFANELVWEYRFDAASGKTTTARRVPKPDYTHHCFVLARAARQFLYHSRFDKNLLPCDDDRIYGKKIREVVSRNPRTPCAAGEEVIFPGYASLHEFSQAREAILKAECGGAWQSYVLRSHWRMIFPISRAHQIRTAESLMTAIGQGIAPVVHLVCFPRLTINHGVLLFSAEETAAGFRFQAYDPNYPGAPAPLTFDRAANTFSFPGNHYWIGGRLDVIEIFRNWLL